MKGSSKTHPVPEEQVDATLSQANPVSATEYTVLDTTRNVRVIGLLAAVTWTVQPTLDIIVTIDGVSIVYTIANPVSATNYYALPNPGNAQNAQNLVVYASWLTSPGQAFLHEGRSVKVTVKTTGGTTSLLTARVKYAKW